MNIAVSGCLLGESIRFDGGHKRDRFITDKLSAFATFVPFCPEHLAFGTPRPSIRLVKVEGILKVHSNKNDADVTEALLHASHTELAKLSQQTLGGIIFKSKSPSCGMKSAKWYGKNGHCEGKEDGVFMALCRERFPLLPIEEEGRLEDAWLRENFVMQLFAYHAFETFKAASPTMGDLVRFHTINKFILQSKNESLYRALGKIVANHDTLPLSTLIDQYEVGFKTAIATKSSIKKTRNVLEHLAGFFKNNLTHQEKLLLHTQIEDYATKIIPLIVPVSTIYLYAKKYAITYLLDQTFLDPYPKTLALRSHLESGK